VELEQPVSAEAKIALPRAARSLGGSGAPKGRIVVQ
jgi:hypothetical protein